MLVRSYRRVVELAEHELATLPDPGWAGSSARPGPAMKVLQIATQTRKLPAVSGLGSDRDLVMRLKLYEDRLAVAEEHARKVLREGPGGLAGVREPRRPPPSPRSSGAEPPSSSITFKHGMRTSRDSKVQ